MDQLLPQGGLWQRWGDEGHSAMISEKFALKGDLDDLGYNTTLGTSQHLDL